MSQGDVEIIKRAIDAFNSRDLDALFEFVTPDYEWVPAMGAAVEDASYRGRGGMERYFEMVSDTWEEFRVVGTEFRDLGDRVLLTSRIEGRGRGSGVPVVTRGAPICDFRDGKMSRTLGFLDRGEALRAAGLDEESG